ncbi:MAG: cbb3-type cytochrome c oxidase subunit I [Phycisphaeraceae bacterium]|nr:cbb3-type cytochrome c oxidase subunit I [Phycisphaeraceae bacterium]
MSVTTTPPITVGHRQQPSSPPPGSNYLNARRGIMSWLITLDHKRIALLYLFGVLGAYFLGGVFALLVRLELFTPSPVLAGSSEKAWELYNHMFTLHGAVMVFLFIIPAIPAIIGNFVLPLMLGAKDLAFPRINLASFYFWLAGGLFFTYVLIKGVLNFTFPVLETIWGPGGLDTGWTFYTPYSTTLTQTAVVEATLGAFILGFASILTGVNFIASIHTLRPKGMTWFRMPLFLWSLYATSIIMILATPVLAITLLLLAAERVLGVGIFDPNMGGDPILYQHFFWFYSHPAVYIMVLPALGILSELISVFSRKHIFGYKFIAISSLAIAFIGFLVWGHHMFVSGQSPLANAIFSLLTFFVAVPSAIKTFNWLATMHKGSISLKTPMVYALLTIFLFVVGGLTGLFLGAINTNVHLTDTYFVVAHFHYVMMGTVLFAFLGAMYYWWPKIWGKMYNENWARIAAIVVFIGFNQTFFWQFIMGSQGMPRRYATYSTQYTRHHQFSTVGAFVMTAGLVMVLANMVHSVAVGRRAPRNPWGGNSLEWHTPSPPTTFNFDRTPYAGDPYNYDHWRYVSEEEGYVYDPPDSDDEDITRP